MNTDEFITEMNNSEQYSGIFDLMVRGRWLFYAVQRMNPTIAQSTVAENLLHPQTGLSWNNDADKIRIIRDEARVIIHLLEGLDRFDPRPEAEELADNLITSLNNAVTDLNSRIDNNNQRGGFRKRKRKSIRIKSKKSRKSRKSRKSIK
jgi:hypothetical protein